jgi:hypothetical protein
VPLACTPTRTLGCGATASRTHGYRLPDTLDHIAAIHQYEDILEWLEMLH